MRERLLAAFVGLTFLTVMLYGVPRAVARAGGVADEAQADVRRSSQVVAEAVQLRREAGLPVTGSPLAYLDAQDHVVLRQDGRVQVLRGGAADAEDDLVATAALPDGGEVEVRRPRQVLREDVAKALAPIVLSGLASLAVAVAAAFLLAARLARPFQQLAARAATLGSGSLNDLPLQRVREAEAIAAALRDGSARVEAMLRREREFARNASHQLRTPLTGMRLRVEDLTLWPETPAVVAEELGHVLVEVDRLSDTVTALLSLAREGQLSGWQQVDLGEVVRAAVARWQPIAAERGRQLVAGAVHPQRVSVPRVAVDQVLDVLVDNGLSHGAGVVTVEVHGQPGLTRFTVRDEGELQVAPQDLFRRRTQDDPHRGGEGIGLALCAELAAAVGGSLVVTARRPTAFQLQVPTAS